MARLKRADEAGGLYRTGQRVPSSSSLAALILLSAVSLVPRYSCAQRPRLTQSKPRNSGKLEPLSVASFPGPVIPGLRQKAIPQGIAYARASKRIIISHYSDHAPSCLSVLDSVTGRLVSSATLQEPSGNLHHGHVGGVAVLEDALFVASDGHVLQYELAPLVKGNPPARVAATAARKCETNASFCAATNDLLLVGEFAYGKDYPTRSSHHSKDRKGVRKYAWVCGYDSADPLGAPKCVLSVRQRVQGMCVSGDRVFLSVSYGRRNRSTIVVYRNPIGEPAHKTVKLQRGDEVPLWFLDGDNYLGEIDFPPMSEGVVMIENRLAVLSESGASKYQLGGKGPLDVVVFLDVSTFK